MNQVVIYTHEFYPKKGGIATVVEEVAYALHEAGREVTVFAPLAKQGGSGQEVFKKFPFSIRPLRNRGTQGWMCRIVTMFSFLKERKRIKNAILYLVEPGPLRAMLYLSLLNLIAPKKIVVTLHGSEIVRLTRCPLNRRLLGRFLKKKVDRISVLSNYCRELLSQAFPQLTNKIVVCEPGVRRGIITNIDKKVFNKDKIILLTVGRIHPRKGQLSVLRAIKELKAITPLPVIYWMVGPVVDKNYEKVLRKFSLQHNLNIIFYGDLEDAMVNKCYDAADIFIMTSNVCKNSVEGYGLVYLEAMAKGLPIVARATGGVEECVNKGSRSVLIGPEEDEKAIAKRLKEWIDLYCNSGDTENEREKPKIGSWDQFALDVIGH